MSLLQEYTEFTRTTAIYPSDQKFTYLGLGLASEAGEVAGKIKKVIRDHGIDVTGVTAELGDVFWYLIRLCDELQVSPESIIRDNMAKLASRKERGVLGGSGDNR